LSHLRQTGQPEADLWQVGTSSPPPTITLKNTGITPLTVSGFQSSTHEYSETYNCSKQALPPGASCTIKMVFAALHAGVRDKRDASA
jgi:hypothetical protein